MKRLYEDERLSHAEIGLLFGVTGQTIGRWLREAGVSPRPFTERQRNQLYPGDETVRLLYVDEKLSLRGISERYDTSIPVVARWLKRAGVKSRSIREGTLLSGKYGVHSAAHSESLRKNIAIARTKITDESREKRRKKMLGRDPPNKGKPMPAAQREKMRAIWDDPEYRLRMSESHRGEKAHNWKGGIKPELARRLDRAEWRRIRREVYERDNWTCADCKQRCLNTKDSRSKPKLKIQAHHIVSRRDGGSDEMENLVTLCMSCHHKRERAGR